DADRNLAAIGDENPAEARHDFLTTRGAPPFNDWRWGPTPSAAARLASLTRRSSRLSRASASRVTGRRPFDGVLTTPGPTAARASRKPRAPLRGLLPGRDAGRLPGGCSRRRGRGPGGRRRRRAAWRRRWRVEPT